MYFAAKDIISEKWVLVFLNIMGRENYALLWRILSPEKQAEQSLGKLMEVLRDYYEPKKVVMVAQFHRKCTINC